MPKHLFGGQRATWGSWFSPSTNLGPGNPIQAIRLISKGLYQLSHLSIPDLFLQQGLEGCERQLFLSTLALGHSR